MTVLSKSKTSKADRMIIPAPDQGSLEKAIQCGIRFLSEHQYPNGEFCCYTSNNDQMMGWCNPDTTVFPTSLIGNALFSLSNRGGLTEVLDKCRIFLESQRYYGYLWQHYTRWHLYYAYLSPDVDNTACASFFLRAMGNKTVEKANRQIILDNVNANGLLFTWFVFRLRFNKNKTYWRIALSKLRQPLRHLFFWRAMECAPNDIDAVVNANALLYLGSSPETRPIIKYLIEVIENEQEHDCDKWYRNPICVYYFISKKL